VTIPRRPVNISDIPGIQADLDPFAFFRVRQAAPRALCFPGNFNGEKQRFFIPTGSEINRQPPRWITLSVPVVKTRNPKRFVQSTADVSASGQRQIIVRETESKNETFREFQKGQVRGGEWGVGSGECSLSRCYRYYIWGACPLQPRRIGHSHYFTLTFVPTSAILLSSMFWSSFYKPIRRNNYVIKNEPP